MLEIFHLNCVHIVSPFRENVCGHCILLKEGNKLVLVDAGIGLQDTLYPRERIGDTLIDLVGYRFDENRTAIRQIEKLGLNPKNVQDCIISHLDNDHIGGLADFPQAKVHLSAEEWANFNAGNARYLSTPLEHQPTLRLYAQNDAEWFGWPARKVHTALQTDIFLLPLFGHTIGHCAVAFHTGSNWVLYVADAYYLREEITDDMHPVEALAAMRADDNALRLASLQRIRELVRNNPDIEYFGYHDINEFERYGS